MDTTPTDQTCSAQIISRQFDDVDEAEQILQMRRDVQIAPLSLERFGATLHQLDFGRVTLIFSEISTPFQLTGDRRSGFTQFGLILESSQPSSYVHQHSVDSTVLCGFDATRGADSIYRAGTVLGEIQVQHDVLETVLATMGRDDLDTNFFRQELIYLPTTLSAYRCYMQELMQLVKQQSSLLVSSSYGQLIVDDVLPLLIDAIPKREACFRMPPHPRQRAQLVRRATEYIEAHIHVPLTLKELYTALGVNRRTLFYSFESVFGVTPMEYIKCQRLQGARRSLKAATLKQSALLQ